MQGLGSGVNEICLHFQYCCQTVFKETNTTPTLHPPLWYSLPSHQCYSHLYDSTYTVCVSLWHPLAAKRWLATWHFQLKGFHCKTKCRECVKSRQVHSVCQSVVKIAACTYTILMHQEYKHKKQKQTPKKSFQKQLFTKKKIKAIWYTHMKIILLTNLFQYKRRK